MVTSVVGCRQLKGTLTRLPFPLCPAISREPLALLERVNRNNRGFCILAFCFGYGLFCIIDIDLGSPSTKSRTSPQPAQYSLERTAPRGLDRSGAAAEASNS